MMPKYFNVKEIVLSTIGAGTLEFPQNMKLDSYLISYITINSKWFIDMYVRAKTISNLVGKYSKPLKPNIIKILDFIRIKSVL